MARFHITRQMVLKAGLLFAVWTAYGLLCTWEIHYWHSFTKMPKSWIQSLHEEMTLAYVWALATPGVIWWARRFRLEGREWPRHLLAHIGLLLVLLPAIGFTCDLLVGPEPWPFAYFTWPKLLRSFELTFDTGALVYVGVVGTEHAFAYYQRYQTGLIRSGQLQTQLVQAQLQALKMQLHPHFLFNTLNSITALVHEDPDLAEVTITRLSELLRLFLANRTVHEVPLAEELRILDLYLEIEQARFEDRLTVHYDVPDELHDAMVPNLVLQPLVENAIRHGIGRRSEPGWIAVSAERSADTLVLRVTDNGAGLTVSDRTPSHQGMGLEITRGRLESLYGIEQSLVVRNLPAGGVEARIDMPFRPEATLSESGNHAELQSADSRR